MKRSHFVSFFCGAAAMLAVSLVSQSVAQTPSHVYELRVYHANPGKLDALTARFGDHTEKIFQRHNIHTIGYRIPQDNPQNLFIYLVQHDSKEAATKNWAAFQNDEEWKKVRAESETNGALNDHVDSTYMNPTTFSRLK
jgi:hypothetical protein